MLPILYVLMSDRQKSSYIYLYKQIRYCLKNNGPKIFLHDYEMSAISSFHEIFPDCTIHGCYFHFAKMLRTNLQKKYDSEYKNSISFKNHIYLFKSLSFVQPKDVATYFNVLINSPYHQKHKKLLEEFTQYFQKNFIGFDDKNPRYNIIMWNNYDLIINCELI